MKAIELFAGVGGLRLGCESVMPINVSIAVEVDPIARYVYQYHFPDTSMHGDIRTFTPTQKADLIYGGFPCTETSSAGKRTGLKGANSGLWWEFYRVIQTAKPTFVVIENPKGLLYRGGIEILRSLASLGYDAEWKTIPASAFGYPHRRDRVFIVAYTYDISQRLCEAQCCWTKHLRETFKSSGVDKRESEAFLRRIESNDGVPSWLGGSVSPQWVSKWKPPFYPGRPKDCRTPLEKIERWVNNKAINFYGLACVPEQAAIAFKYVKFLNAL